MTTSSPRTIIEAKQLVKRYDDRRVVDGVNLEIFKGECFGLLGPNGAGKTTLMKMMYCNSLVSDGELFVLGLNAKKNVREIKNRIGVVPQEDGLDGEFSVLENLLLFGSYQGLDPVSANRAAMDLLRVMRLEEFLDRRVETLSGGMRRRLAIARGLVHHPDLFFLDEPTTGLDPQARIWIWDFLKKMKAENGTIVLTTHYMEEAETMCDRIAIMDHGKILALDTPKNLIKENVGIEVIEFETSPTDLNYYLGRFKEHGVKYQVIRNQVNLHLQQGQDSREVMNLFASPRITVRKPTLNDVFLKIAGYDLKENQ